MKADPEHRVQEQGRKNLRTSAALEVEVEVAGEKRIVLLVAKDIGTGGIFLRTPDPAPLWKRVRLSIELPQGGFLEVGGEVVRSLNVEAAKTAGQPAGMAVAFDEASRTKRDRLTSLVQELVSSKMQAGIPPPGLESDAPRQDKKEPRRVESPAPPMPVSSVGESRVVSSSVPMASSTALENRADRLLAELDNLLDSVEKPGTKRPTASSGVSQPSKVVSSGNISPEVDVEKLRLELQTYRSSLHGDTHYHVLGVGLKADSSEIEAAYKDLMQRLQIPTGASDIPQDLRSDLMNVLGKIRKAHGILGKPDRRRAYDFLIDNANG